MFWVRTGKDDKDPTAVGRFVRDRYYKNPDCSDFWVTLSGKPLLVTTDTLPDKLVQNFTLRKMWGLQGRLANGEWSFLQNAPQNVGTIDGVPEQVSVSTAKQANYMTDKATATPRKQGKTYQSQWQRAFDVHPKVVILTWWNEWIAQRQANDASGNPQFVDNYNGGKPLSTNYISEGITNPLRQSIRETLNLRILLSLKVMAATTLPGPKPMFQLTSQTSHFLEI